MDPLILVAVVGSLLVGLGIGLTVERRRTPARAALRTDTEVGPVPPPTEVASGSVPTQGLTDPALLGPEGRVIAGLVGTGILHVGEDLRIDQANRAARALLGVRQGSLLGRTVMEAFLDRRVEDLIASASADGVASEELTLRDGEVRELVIRARRSPSSGTWLVVEDVSELRRLQRIRTEFIDNLSHELRTPLTNVGLLAETLVLDVDAAGDTVPPRVRDRVGKIEVETGHLVQMVSEMLDLSRIESGGSIPLVDEVDPVDLAVAATERLRVFAERQGVTLLVDAPTATPRVRGDEDRLSQVLVNLLHNAIKFSPDGGDVTVRVRSTDREVVIAVEDHGIGIPEAARDRVFERFFKVDRARVRGGGTGLGLSIARHIAGAHGGRIELESTEGAGSTFSVVLPVAVDVEAEPGHPDAEAGHDDASAVPGPAIPAAGGIDPREDIG